MVVGREQRKPFFFFIITVLMADTKTSYYWETVLNPDVVKHLLSPVWRYKNSNSEWGTMLLHI
jgi:hypothetical protein